MRFIRDLTFDTAKLLHRIYKQSRHYQVRQRAHCILLSYEGVTISELIDFFQVSRRTIYNWMNDWEDKRLLGLYNQTGRGRKPTFNEEQKQKIKSWVKLYPKDLKKVLAQIKEEWGITVSKDTIKRVLRSLIMTWRRFQRGLAGEPDPLEYKEKELELTKLKEQEKRGEIDLRYLDESGFCLTPYVPYGWQEKGEKIPIKSSRSRRLNILGLMNRHQELDAYIFEGRITSEVVISCLDKFAENLPIKTVVVMDKASFHRSKKIQDKIDEWKHKNLEIFWLPSYSPQLNLIEILWRFMKYEWIEIDAYSSWQNLINYVEKVIREFGKEYVINFA
ncbi:IS630 family transposase [Cuspidothrix issatschenkoi LEGE 03284]|jgi:transposase|uniref:IS630 family transposase n=1 Tax=Cuspidothrix issatschenkoi TaxID=230752 RepID=UPI001882A851|nr:IS630 family transposase [Cuspidothrix issatschenkoi]MBE9230584.1 IS630 family transposase [Cuspidothrix issatschenkoi LEGE 03284]